MVHNKNNPKAIMLIIIGMTVFALQDTFIKLLSSNTNIYLIYFVRCSVGLLVIISYLKYNKIPIVYKTHYPLLTISRTICFFLGFSLYYFSLSKLTLPLAVTLFFVSPFFVTIFYNERKSWIKKMVSYFNWFFRSLFGNGSRIQ